MKKFGAVINDYAKGKIKPSKEVMSVAPTPYLQKQALFPAQISGKPSEKLGMIVVIPAKDEPGLTDSLSALKMAKKSTSAVEVIVVINDSERDGKALQERNQLLFEKSNKWARANSKEHLKFHILYHRNLPHKHAGVGLARKIGMDEAVYRFEQVDLNTGVIICFDADSSCKPSYFRAIENHFKEHPKTQACSIHYEHPLEGEAFPKKVYRAIALYELHLRYYTHAQRFVGYPFASETVGSSMAVRADAYQSQGGMNRRKAGEDFYFLHKFTPLGNCTDIRNTMVIPSPRRSDRVPFGTGKAVREISGRPKELFESYAPQSFIDLKVFFELVPQMRNWTKDSWQQELSGVSVCVRDFLETVYFESKFLEIKKNTSNTATFQTRFFRWFNAFIIMKYVHYARDHFYPNIPVEEAASWLLRSYFKNKVKADATAAEMLLKLRKLHLKS